MQILKRLDDGIARGEGAIAAFVLITMILVASIQAGLRNLTYFDLQWANDALLSFDWADQYLKKGTLWLAFLGASLATRDERHIGIDVLPKLLPAKAKLVVRGLVGFCGAFISFFLARAFWSAVLINAEERPPSYEVWADGGSLHVCDASAAALSEASVELPGIFCGVRSLLATLGAPVESPQAALQLIVPVMFVMIAIRLFANGIGSFMDLNKPPEPEKKPAAAAAVEPAAASDTASDSDTDSDTKGKA